MVTSPSLSDSKVFEMAGSPYGMNGSIEGFMVMKPPTSRRLKFSFLLRGSAKKQTFAIETVGYNLKAKGINMLATAWEKTGPLQTDAWSRCEYEVSLPPEIGRLHVIIHNPNAQSIYIGSLSLVAGAASAPDFAAVARAKKEVALMLEERAHPRPNPFQQMVDDTARHPGPVVAHVLLRVPLCTKKLGERGTFTFPVPEFGDGQTPLAFKIRCDGPGKLLGYSWRKRADGRNYVCDVAVQPGVKGSWVQYDALVLLGSTQAPELTPPAVDWKRSTACVQSSASEVRQVEQKLSTPGDGDEAYAHKVFEFVRDDNGKGAPFKTLDALAALQCGGSCTNKANLVAALLRARGIPARTVAHMPTWCKEKMYEHWLAEYWQPGQGWVAIDSALGRWAPDRRTRIVLSIANPADEDLAFDPLHERFVMPGAPYASVAELSPLLYPADLTETDEINCGDEVSRLDVADEAGLFSAADGAFGTLFGRLEAGTPDDGRYDRVMAAARSGKASAVLAAIGG
jgi:hypothetical protein